MHKGATSFTQVPWMSRRLLSRSPPAGGPLPFPEVKSNQVGFQRCWSTRQNLDPGEPSLKRTERTEEGQISAGNLSPPHFFPLPIYSLMAETEGRF